MTGSHLYFTAVPPRPKGVWMGLSLPLRGPAALLTVEHPQSTPGTQKQRPAYAFTDQVRRLDSQLSDGHKSRYLVNS